MWNVICGDVELRTRFDSFCPTNACRDSGDDVLIGGVSFFFVFVQQEDEWRQGPVGVVGDGLLTHMHMSGSGVVIA